MFNDKLWKFTLDRIGNFNSGTILKEKANYSYNEFISDEYEVYETNFDLLKYSFDIENIIYE